MSAYYSFHHPSYSAAEMDPSRRVPDANFDMSLADKMKQSVNVQPVEYIPTCTKPQPVQTWIQWKDQYSGCAPTWVSWKEATNGQYQGAEVGQKDSRIWVANLNPGHYWRGIITGAEWQAESTQSHIRARTAFAQYLTSTLYPNSSPNEKRIDSPSESYASLVRKYGAPQYTSF